MTALVAEQRLSLNLARDQQRCRSRAKLESQRSQVRRDARTAAEAKVHNRSGGGGWLVGGGWLMMVVVVGGGCWWWWSRRRL
jgi:hypothetical protein